jgi:hypothetical protein
LPRACRHGGSAHGSAPRLAETRPLALAGSLKWARGPAERGPAARGPAARGPAARGPAARGPAARGPAERGPAERRPTCGRRRRIFGLGRIGRAVLPPGLVETRASWWSWSGARSRGDDRESLWWRPKKVCGSARERRRGVRLAAKALKGTLGLAWPTRLRWSEWWPKARTSPFSWSSCFYSRRRARRGHGPSSAAHGDLRSRSPSPMEWPAVGGHLGRRRPGGRRPGSARSASRRGSRDDRSACPLPAEGRLPAASGGAAARPPPPRQRRLEP